MPKALVTNDDGIESFFLRALVEALLPKFEVTVAAPTSEQSWIGRAFSRVGSINASEYNDFDCPAWAISGTPSDCVNIALGHLLSPEQQPDIVLSGINIGYNSAMPFILSSGTIGGALEGTFWGLPALAFSHTVPVNEFVTVRANDGKVKGELARSLKHAAEHATTMAVDALNEKCDGLKVHNVNFPINTNSETPIETTEPAIFQIGSLFNKTADGSFEFGFPAKYKHIRSGKNTDYACINQRGNISRTILDYSTLGVKR